MALLSAGMESASNEPSWLDEFFAEPATEPAEPGWPDDGGPRFVAFVRSGGVDVLDRAYAHRLVSSHSKGGPLYEAMQAGQKVDELNAADQAEALA